MVYSKPMYLSWFLILTGGESHFNERRILSNGLSGFGVSVVSDLPLIGYPTGQRDSTLISGHSLQFVYSGTHSILMLSGSSQPDPVVSASIHSPASWCSMIVPSAALSFA
ncbi:hypothetical protein DFH06DRAFT_1240835 [Mycena polygramma]|nr:hypothetical protein DFH06DRAFT_1240835 [Mycena polygramma]